MKIVLWRLGSLEHKIFPTSAAVNKLTDMLNKLEEDRTNHLVWSPELDVQIVDVEDLSQLDQYILVYKGNNQPS